MTRHGHFPLAAGSIGRCALTWTALILALLAPASAAQAQDAAAPAPPSVLEASDYTLDGGEQIQLAWKLSPDDRQLTPEEKRANEDRPPEEQIRKPVTFYKVLRSTAADGAYYPVGRAEPDKWDYVHGEMTFAVEKCMRNETYFFKIAAVGPTGLQSVLIGPSSATATLQWYDKSRFWMMVITGILCGSVIYWINHARKGRPVKVRKIAGLEAVDEAVGRATEMGRSCLFIPGIQDMNDIQTIAGITVLARVSRTAAEYDAKVEVPTSRALVMTTAQETVQASFLAAGRPDAYNEDLIYYVTDEQFGYVAYLQGMMVREKPAACFYMGSFFAESLILAETGNSIGAIQVAGTAQPAQLPFFVAACDYTLIGEEFFAASAYLSGTPEEMGSLKGQDVGKVVVAVGLVVGVTFATLASLAASETGLFDMLTEFIKTKVMT
ncbi:MAG: DUF6754 domain-containing protein [Planctomycetota bacterium]|jgi:hypothetical protein